ncbi:MAG: cell division protein FtsZ, partial [Bacteroidales bacterium]
NFEGRKRRLQAEKGIEELKKNVDTLLIISNEKLREIHGNLKLSEAFGRADDILTTAAKGIAEIITVTGYINVDFEDVKTVMKNSGTAIMGSAVAEGEDRARTAVREALASPLLNDNKITGASDILLYISSGKEEITFDEVTEITDYIQEEAGMNAEVIWGNGFDESLGDKISITLIATGFKAPDEIDETTFSREKKKTVYTLDDSLNKEEQKSTEIPAETETEDKPLEEITLVKKEKSEAEKKPEKESSTNDGTMLLFDQPRKINETKPAGNGNGGSAAGIGASSFVPKNSNLRIKHTVGDFPKKEEITDKQPELQKEVMDKKSEDRIKKLRDLSLSFHKSPEQFEDLEKVPAYVRKNVELKPVKASSESSISRFTLGVDDEDDAEIQKNDIPFIHNKPD